MAKLAGVNRQKLHNFFQGFPLFEVGKKVKNKTKFNGDKKVFIQTETPIVKKFSVKLDTPFEGMGNLKRFSYQVKDGHKFSEEVQTTNGEFIFTAIKDQEGNWVEETMWSDNEICELVNTKNAG